MTGNILVDPQKLIGAAEEFEGLGGEVNGITQEMLMLIESLSKIWEGEAHTAYLTKFNGLKNDMSRIHSMIKEHATDLQTMAQNYIKAEGVNVDNASSLNDEIIS